MFLMDMKLNVAEVLSLSPITPYSLQIRNM